MDDEDEWEVEVIVNKRDGSKTLQYLVKWIGYNDIFNQWLSAKQLDHIEELWNAFNNIAQLNCGRDQRKKAWPSLPMRQSQSYLSPVSLTGFAGF